MLDKVIPTEQIGSIPRPVELIEAYRLFEKRELSKEKLDAIALEATIRTIKELEETGSPCISDGEQRKFTNFASYCLHGADNVSPEGVETKFADGHTRCFIPRLVSGPFRYQHSADEFLDFSLKHSKLPVKQAVTSPSMLSLLYPPDGIADYPLNQFIQDVISEHVGEIRRCLDKGAHKVQIDFTEGRLSLKLDPSGGLLKSFIELINKGLAHFDEEDLTRVGIHTCPGSDLDSTHSADIDYKYLLPTLFEINVGSFYIAMASEKSPRKTLRMIKQLIKPHHRVFIGVVDPVNPVIESPELVRDRVLQAAEFIPIDQLGSSDDCGFSPFFDDLTTSRELAFDKIRSRVLGTKMAEKILFV
jgi:methionine synthase II (cobalamin-independent)